MEFLWDPVTILNLVLCVIILALGLVGWRRSGKRFSLFVAIAFGLFGLSHLATILGLKDSFALAMIPVRMIAYLLVVLAVYSVAFRTE